MAKSNINSKKGFTIIEVVLVLAIAGLIFLMVFIALPALQRSQRDTQRRDDMSRLATAINQYQTNNGGKLPAADGKNNTSFITKYMEAKGDGDEFVDPSGEAYTVVFTTIDSKNKGEAQNDLKSDGAGDTNSFQVTVYEQAVCDGEVAVQANNKRDYAIVYNLEGSGSSCLDSGGAAKKSTPSGE